MTKAIGPVWISWQVYRPGIIALLPRLGLTRDWGDACLELGWLKRCLKVGWRGF